MFREDRMRSRLIASKWLALPRLGGIFSILNALMVYLCFMDLTRGQILPSPLCILLLLALTFPLGTPFMMPSTGHGSDSGGRATFVLLCVVRGVTSFLGGYSLAWFSRHAWIGITSANLARKEEQRRANLK
jgi:hypothetical protein